MAQLIPILMQLIGGAAGGNGVGVLLKNANLSTILKTVLGVVGGVAGGQFADMLPMLQGLLGDAAGTGSQVVGNAGAGAIGGALLTLVGGLIKQAMDKSKTA